MAVRRSICIKKARQSRLHCQLATMEYSAIPKGRGFVYAYESQTYKRVRTVGGTKYLKCIVVGCDGSAKLVGDQFIVGVSAIRFVFNSVTS